MIDGFRGFRSRFEQISLIQEVLEELPEQLGLQPVMPAFVLPYFNGVVPEDCGVSGFLFLAGGHFTLHTFSFRETYFADLVAPASCDVKRIRSVLETAFPCETTTVIAMDRHPEPLKTIQPQTEVDFGPHLLLDIQGFQGPRSMDALFALFDRLPSQIGMTPIMRPYIVRSETANVGPVLSAMTMIAESHVSIHIFESSHEAYFDLFSCRFFEYPRVLARLREALPGDRVVDGFLARGRNYKLQRTERHDEVARSKSWLRVVASRDVDLG